jgi:purine-nucleoside phosphorylase
MGMTSLSEQVQAAAASILRHGHARPRVGVILGTGLSDFAQEIESLLELPYQSIPHFVEPTAPTHRGLLVQGRLGGMPIVALAGRFHCYEGHRAATSAFPVRVLCQLGVETLIISNACGGMNPDYRVGDIMLVEDQINFTFDGPLIGTSSPQRGIVDMSRPFDEELLSLAATIARREDFVAHRGVYVGVLGPNYETRAEYRMFRRLGADAVGMSTVHEVIVARQCGMRVLALSVVTNECRPEDLEGAKSHEVECAATAAAPKVRAIIRGVAEHLGHETTGHGQLVAESPVTSS